MNNLKTAHRNMMQGLTVIMSSDRKLKDIKKNSKKQMEHLNTLEMETARIKTKKEAMFLSLMM